MLVKVVADKAPTKGELQEALLSTAARFFGEVGLSKMNPRVVRYDEKDWLAVIGGRRQALDDLRAALALVTEIAGQPAAMLVLRSAGTIRSLVHKHRKLK